MTLTSLILLGVALIFFFSLLSPPHSLSYMTKNVVTDSWPPGLPHHSSGTQRMIITLDETFSREDSNFSICIRCQAGTYTV